jgi:hypothetical protein
MNEGQQGNRMNGRARSDQARRTSSPGRWMFAVLGAALLAMIAGPLARPAGAQAGATALQIICPASQSVAADFHSVTASVQPGTATSVPPGATIVGVRSDGLPLTLPYPVGVTTITWTATDSLGNVQTCTQTITVGPTFTTVIVGPGSANPHIDGLTPVQGPLNQRVIIHGTGFADVQGSSYVLFAGRLAPVLSWTAGAINFVVTPPAANQPALALNTAYPVQVITPASGKQSNTVNFFLTDAAPADYPNAAVAGPSDQPSFECFNKKVFCPGDVVSFLGAGFGSTQGTGFVTVTVPLADTSGNIVTQEFAVPVLSWAENVISFILNLPSGAAPGMYTATVHRGNGKTTTGSFIVGTRDANGNCAAMSPVLLVSPLTLTFGPTAPDNTSEAQTITVTNAGTAPLILSAVTPGGAADQFLRPTTCEIGTPIAPGDQCTVQVRYAPSFDATTGASATLTFVSNGGTETVHLTGTIPSTTPPTTATINSFSCVPNTAGANLFTILGSAFGATQGSGSVLVAGTFVDGMGMPLATDEIVVPVTNWSDTSITVQFPLFDTQADPAAAGPFMLPGQLYQVVVTTDSMQMAQMAVDTFGTCFPGE